jgi:hypothetical protein
MLINDSADSRWLEIFALLSGAPFYELVTPQLFDTAGALELWDWAVHQRGPIAAGDSPWVIYAQDAPAWVVRHTLPVWVGILALHPSPAPLIMRVAREVPLIAPFADQALSEWVQALEEGWGSVPPTIVSLVPRDGDWTSVFPPADSWLNVPVQGRVERMSPRPTSPGRRRPRRYR